jgi:hypothetical protein
VRDFQRRGHQEGRERKKRLKEIDTSKSSQANLERFFNKPG